MEALVLFLVVFVGLWMGAEGLGILYRQYKQDKASCDKNVFDCLADLKGCGSWGIPGAGKVYPSARPGCDVCGVWTPKATCSDCCTWAEVQSIDCELREQDRLWGWSYTEHSRLVKAAGW